MKLLFVYILIIATTNFVKAQDPTLGKSRDEIRNLIKPNTGINLLKGNNTDTLTMDGGLRIVIYYQNDTCYTSKSTMPLSLLSMVTDKMKTYKKVKENMWISPSGIVRVEVTITKNEDNFYIETSYANKEAKKP
nr:hypothetical protein [Mucilaginibacter sp. L294]